MAQNESVGLSKGLVPIPDPTVLTTEALRVAIASLREVLNEKIDCITKLKDEKFKEIHARLDSIERRRIELKADVSEVNKSTISSITQLFNLRNETLLASTAKTELFFTKQIEGISEQFEQGRQIVSEKINSLKERMDRGTGRTEQVSEQRQVSSWIVPMVLIGGIALINLILNLLRFIK